MCLLEEKIKERTICKLTSFLSFLSFCEAPLKKPHVLKTISLQSGATMGKSEMPKIWINCFPGYSVVKSLPTTVGDTGDVDSIPGSRRYTEGGNGNPLQYACMGNPMTRGATVFGVEKG